MRENIALWKLDASRTPLLQHTKVFSRPPEVQPSRALVQACCKSRSGLEPPYPNPERGSRLIEFLHRTHLLSGKCMRGYMQGGCCTNTTTKDSL